ncbi:MAG: histidine--tRNA ligase [Holosporales bacterium]|jgi:histidyl-tRNA synthetase|nr:histidine--tRNA ligase [Holosporales bacterium]
MNEINSANENMKMIRSVRGMRDLFGKQADIFCTVMDGIKRVVLRHGYSYIETPILEFTQLFARSIGESTDVVGKEMFSFMDRSGQNISLRPEGTASVVRAFIEHNLVQKLPQKLFYYGPMFRYDRPQRGRYRQFFQFGVENLGENSPLSDVDVIVLASEVLANFNIKNTLYLNSLGDVETRNKYKAKLVEYFSQYSEELSTDSKLRLTNNPLRILDSKNAKDQEIVYGAPSIINFLTKDAAKFFERVQEALSLLGIAFQLDKTLVRGLDYYDHTTFEFKTCIQDNGTENDLAVLGGGRYNGLIEQIGGTSVPAVGLAFGVDRLMLAYNAEKIVRKNIISILFVTQNEENDALLLCTKLRQHGFSVIMPLDGSLTKRTKCSDRAMAICALFIGEDEVRDATVKCKFFTSTQDFPESTEIIINKSEIIQFFHNLFVDS